MKFILVTIPLRKAGSYLLPPLAATSLLNTLIKEGYEPMFYDIDAKRYDFEQVVNFFRNEQPDIVGISAVVSTAYQYVKKLSHAIKLVSPKTKIMLGGCLAASAEILLRKCPIDVCVIGEGEKILINLIKHWEKFHDFDSSRKELGEIKGISFIDPKNDFIFTGYAEQLLPEEMPQPDYDLLSKYSDINEYIIDGPGIFKSFELDHRYRQPHRKGQKCLFVMTGKGCASRCTFCHRWVRGYRTYPIDNIINTMKYLKDKYNAGFFLIGDESFGTDPRMLDKFIEAVRPLDILFRVGAIRVSTVYRNPEIVRRLKEVGCVEMVFGIESGSDKILTIMEKGASSKQNLEVAKLLSREGMNTTHQLVIGMPGENEETVKETIQTMKSILDDPSVYPLISISYFQSLPGTPAYEFMRLKGLIGKTLDDEEAYLLKISDVNAGSSKHYVNVSEECRSRVLLWQHKIRVETTIHWYGLRKWRPFKKPPESPSEMKKRRSESVLKQIWHIFNSSRFYFIMVMLLNGAFWWLTTFVLRIRLYGVKKAFFFSFGIKREEDRSQFIIKNPKSLRQLISYPDSSSLSISEANMLPLRKGR